MGSNSSNRFTSLRTSSVSNSSSLASHYIKIQFFIYYSDFFVFGHVKTSLHYIHGTSRQILTNYYKFFHKKRKKRYCIDFLLYTISFFYIYTFIVFARDVSKAAISGLPSTFISSSESTPSGYVACNDTGNGRLPGVMGNDEPQMEC